MVARRFPVHFLSLFFLLLALAPTGSARAQAPVCATLEGVDDGSGENYYLVEWPANWSQYSINMLLGDYSSSTFSVLTGGDVVLRWWDNTDSSTYGYVILSASVTTFARTEQSRILVEGYGPFSIDVCIPAAMVVEPTPTPTLASTSTPTPENTPTPTTTGVFATPTPTIAPTPDYPRQLVEVQETSFRWQLFTGILIVGILSLIFVRKRV